MRDVVIVGGGLTGLVAAYELSKYELDVTLIEVKRHLGGSLRSIQQDNCILDSTAFAIQNRLNHDWLASLGLANEMFSLADDTIAFKSGTGHLIAALKGKITATRLMRMAVSSIGQVKDGRYSICMENGLMFDAKSLILAVPARYAERMFYGYINGITEKLLDYHYDRVVRVSLVCRTKKLPEKISTPPDMAYLFIHRSNHPARVPEGYTLLQFGIRVDPKRFSSDQAIVDFLTRRFRLPKVLTAHIGYWSEADPLSCYENGHAEWIASIREALPPNVALVGSDYSLAAPPKQGVVDLNERIQQGIDAAQSMIANL